MHEGGEFLHADALAEVLADVGDGAVDLEVGAQHFFLSLVALGGAHHADDFAIATKDGELVGDEPVGDALGIEEQLHDVELGLAAAHDFLVDGAVVLGELLGEEGEVILAHDLVFRLAAEALVEVAVRTHETELRVLGEEGHAGHVVEQQVELAVRGEGTQEAVAQVRFSSGHGDTVRMDGRAAKASLRTCTPHATRSHACTHAYQ